MTPRLASAEVLAPFGLLPSLEPNRCIFGSKFLSTVARIRERILSCKFDHRPFLPERDQAYPHLQTPEFRRGYAGVKFTVAEVLRPSSIVEIGVGAGTGAIAMLTASPQAHYTGIDDGSKEAEDGFPYLDFVREMLEARGHAVTIRRADSRGLEMLPCVGLIHVDGNHLYEYARYDCKLAWESHSPWILIDDAHDPAVMQAATDSILGHFPGQFEWAFFEDTWTGNLLIHRKAT
jgi:hypothetical protein